mmetsp:Transcript_101484/g.290964  ORF Transcript_101484/g.290964 Transcript_101484/m.290964 type:complete len:187 (+) Transcript_101484:111-671(+)
MPTYHEAETIPAGSSSTAGIRRRYGPYGELAEFVDPGPDRSSQKESPVSQEEYIQKLTARREELAGRLALHEARERIASSQRAMHATWALIAAFCLWRVYYDGLEVTLHWAFVASVVGIVAAAVLWPFAKALDSINLEMASLSLLGIFIPVLSVSGLVYIYMVLDISDEGEDGPRGRPRGRRRGRR